VSSPDTIFSTRTTTRLLDALRDLQNEPAWAQIDSRYRPVLTGLARRLGLNGSDADEVAQQALAEFVRAYRDGRYDRSKGRLSSWILGIGHHTALRVIRRGRNEKNADSVSVVEAVDEPTLRSIWEDERDRAILSQAMTMLSDESSIDDRTYLAFELFAMRRVPVAEVANRCEMTTDQVYVAKSRVTKKLREIVATLTEAFEEDS